MVMLASAIQRYLRRLRFPYLLVLAVVLLVVNLIVWDPLPLVDEVLLAVLAVIIGSIRSRHDPPDADGEA